MYELFSLCDVTDLPLILDRIKWTTSANQRPSVRPHEPDPSYSSMRRLDSTRERLWGGPCASPFRERIFSEGARLPGNAEQNRRFGISNYIE